MGLDMEIRRNNMCVISMRNAYAIRNWFMKHLDNFVDNGATPISKDDVKALIDDMSVVANMISSFYYDYETSQRLQQNNEDQLWDLWDNFVQQNDIKYQAFREVANKMLPTYGRVKYDTLYIEQLITKLYEFRTFYDRMGQEDQDDVLEYVEWY